MPCYSPIHGYKGLNGQFTQNHAKSPTGLKMTIPCTKCIGCRLEHSRQWATRMVHELKYHEDAVFITLTYNDKHLPENGSLNLTDWQDFMVKLRNHFAIKLYDSETKKTKRVYKNIKFYQAGEYGKTCQHCQQNKHSHDLQINGACNKWLETFGRPHHHAIIYGITFDDLEFYKYSKAGENVYTSTTLSSLWTDENGESKGYTSVGNVTFESCAYVSRYVTKKHKGTPESAKQHYRRLKTDIETGLLLAETPIKPEYATMSKGNRKRPNNGIGTQHYKEYGGDIFPHDRVVLQRLGQKPMLNKPPRYYDKLLQKDNEEMFNQVKKRRLKAAKNNKEESTEERLYIRQKIKEAQTATLQRETYYD